MLDALHRDLTWATLEQGMRGLREQELAIAKNIANAQTPGYHREEVDFRTSLQQALGQPGDRGKLSADVRGGEVTHFEIEGEKMLNDGNSVDAMMEMERSTQNSLDKGMTYTLMQKKLRMYKMVIRDGR